MYNGNNLTWIDLHSENYPNNFTWIDLHSENYPNNFTWIDLHSANLSKQLHLDRFAL